MCTFSKLHRCRPEGIFGVWCTLRLIQHRIHEYTTYKQQVKRLYLTAVRGPVPRQMSRWKAKGLQMLQRRQSWLDDHT